MFIGQCWFNVDRGELVNKTTGEAMKLSSVEQVILNRIFLARGQVVSIASICQELQPLKGTEQAIFTGVAKFKAFLGSENGSMIELVSDQGIMLRSSPKPSMRHRLKGQYHELSARQCVVLFTIILSLIIFLALKFETTKSLHFLASTEHVLRDSSSRLVPLYANKTEFNDFEDDFKDLALLIESCKEMHWETIYVSASNNKNLIFSLKNNTDSLIPSRNIQVPRGMKKIEKNDNQWLKKFGICQ